MVFGKILNALGAGKSTKQGDLSILIVDDEKSVAQLLSVYLEKLSCNITHAASVSEANDIAESKDHFDLLILDVYLPGGNGLKLLQKLRKNSHLAQTPVVVISGHLPSAQMKEIETKFDNVKALQKPFKMKDFQEAVQKLLETKGFK